MRVTGFVVGWTDEAGAERHKHFLGQAAIEGGLLHQASEF